MEDIEEGLILFFEQVAAKKLPEAKTMINSSLFYGEGRLGQGRRSALQGIVNLLNGKSDTFVIFEKKLEKMAEIFSKRMNTIWCDDFDRGYFEVWMKFIEFSQKHLSEGTLQE
jgi:hypothetical protein